MRARDASGICRGSRRVYQIQRFFLSCLRTPLAVGVGHVQLFGSRGAALSRQRRARSRPSRRSPDGRRQAPIWHPALYVDSIRVADLRWIGDEPGIDPRRIRRQSRSRPASPRRGISELTCRRLEKGASIAGTRTLPIFQRASIAQPELHGPYVARCQRLQSITAQRFQPVFRARCQRA